MSEFITEEKKENLDYFDAIEYLGDTRNEDYFFTIEKKIKKIELEVEEVAQILANQIERLEINSTEKSLIKQDFFTDLAAKIEIINRQLCFEQLIILDQRKDSCFWQLVVILTTLDKLDTSEVVKINFSEHGYMALTHKNSCSEILDMNEIFIYLSSEHFANRVLECRTKYQERQKSNKLVIKQLKNDLKIATPYSLGCCSFVSLCFSEWIGFIIFGVLSFISYLVTKRKRIERNVYL